MKLVYSFMALALVTAGQQSLACSCAAPDSVEVELSKSAAVLTGKVTKVAKLGGAARSLGVTFEVQKGYQGIPWQKNMLVRNAPNGAMCGNDFEVGKEYLVYGLLSENGELYTNLCTRTVALDRAASDIAELEKLTK